ncbi:MAG: CDP-alcohol phosphatidyltransferase family protein [Clostridia bacterium]|nr:CDP-alcohol phosphatidyltransferase family protein [Clostridia bacterium]
MMEKERGILTLPNILTLYRMLLAPILYLALIEGMHSLAILVFLLSGASDLADGFLARHLGEISSLGKALDPIADKMTDFLLLLGLISYYPILKILLIALAVKETACGIASLIAIHYTSRVEGAKIHGKITGCVLFCTLFLHLLFTDLPKSLSVTTTVLSLLALAVSCVLYLVRHISAVPRSKRNIVEDFIRRM